MRNIMTTVPGMQKKSFGAELKKIWKAETKKYAMKLNDVLAQKYGDKYGRAVEYPEVGFEDSVRYYRFSGIGSGKISGTSTQERLNTDIRRGSP